MKVEVNKKSSSTPKQRPVEAESEQRFLSRIPVRKNEGINANIYIQNSAAPLKLRVIDVSSTGIGLEAEEPLAFSFQKGSHADLELAYRTNQYILPCTISYLEKRSDGKTKIGFQRTDINKPISSFKPLFKATTHHPLYYNEVVLLKVMRISTEKAIIECEDPEFIAFPFMPISFHLNLSRNKKKNQIIGHVTKIHVPEPGKTVFEVKVSSMPSGTKKIIANQLFQRHGWEPKDIRNNGFYHKGFRPLIKYRSVNTEEEYLDVLKLRKHAYASVDKVCKDCPCQDLASDLDQKSRILTAYHHDQLIGTVGIMFPDNESLVLDTEKTFENGYPIKLPPKTNMIEIARLCIREEYRSTDIMFGLFEHVYRVLITSERDYIITSTDEHMWPLYKRIGFLKTGMTYAHPLLNGLKHDIIIVHRSRGLHSRGVSIFVWGRLYKDMTEHLLLTGAVSFNFYEKCRFNINKSILNVAERFLSIVNRIQKIRKRK